MCGILGYVAEERNVGLERGLPLLAHRGPDGVGEFHRRASGLHYWFGHRRLSIIDLSGGAQPLQKDELVVTFNGEIYNYVEVAAELRRDHSVEFNTRSDTEVLLEAFRVWGPACLQRLNGMWAFAILNTKSGEIFCARDRMGKKPFYFVAQNGGFYFSSEPPPLLHVLPRLRADNESMLAYLLGAQAPSDRSFFAGIEKLPPGHSLTVGPASLRPRIERYWAPSSRRETRNMSFDDAVVELRTLVSDSVRLRLRSDVGYAVAASGGLDSTIVLATAEEQATAPVRTVSVTFDEAFEWDETEYIERLRDHYAITPTYARARTTISLTELLQDVKAVIETLAEPTPYTSVPYVSMLYEATARSGVKVLIEGQGADELFGGYPYFRAHQQFALARGWVTSRDYLLALRRRSSIVRDLYYRFNTFHFYLTDAARELVHLPEITRSVNDALIDAQQCTVLPGLLDYSDRLAMRWGVEVRLPFLDYRLVEFVNSIPAPFKVRGIETKRILRAAYASGVPHSILKRPKVGFGSPTASLIASNLDQLVDRFITKGRFANSFLFRHGLRQRLRPEFLRSLPNAERVLWRFMLLDIWLEHFGLDIAS